MWNRTFLAESEHYYVASEFEVVTLRDIRKGRFVVIGDFYGDPEAAMIDRLERWVVMVGCGLILYRIQEPFVPYEYDLHNHQWSEMFRSPPDDWWIEFVQQVSDDELEFVADPNGSKAGCYRLDTQSLSARPLFATGFNPLRGRHSELERLPG